MTTDTIIKVKRTAVSGRVPTAGQMAEGELALNMPDGKVYYKDNNGAVKTINSDAKWTNIVDKPAVIAAGATAQLAREAIGAAVNETTVNLGTGNTINLANGRVFTASPTTATTYSVSNVPAAPNATCFILDLTNTSNVAITWWANIKWPKGTAPALKVGRNLLGFLTHDGVNWVGMVLAEELI